MWLDIYTHTYNRWVLTWPLLSGQIFDTSYFNIHLYRYMCTYIYTHSTGEGSLRLLPTKSTDFWHSIFVYIFIYVYVYIYTHKYNRWGLTTLATSSMDKFSTLHILIYIYIRICIHVYTHIQQVRAHYAGYLLNGKIFDTSYRPALFPFRSVIMSHVKFIISVLSHPSECAMMYSCVCHALVLRLPSPIHVCYDCYVCAMICRCVCHDVFMCDPWFVHVCAMTYLWVRRDISIRAQSEDPVGPSHCHQNATWLIVWVTPHSHYLQIVTWIIHPCDVTFWNFEIPESHRNLNKKEIADFFFANDLSPQFSRKLPLENDVTRVCKLHDSFESWHISFRCATRFLQMVTCLVCECTMIPWNYDVAGECMRHDSFESQPKSMRATRFLQMATCIMHECTMTPWNSDVNRVCM